MKGIILNVALHGQKTQNNLIKVLVLIILFSFPAFCIYKYDDGASKIPDAKNQKEYGQKWEKYGAYYDKDEVILNSYYTMNSATSRVEIFKKIKILTTEGAEYGTIPVWRYSHIISHFEPHLYAAGGAEVKLDVKKMRKTYTEVGKVVFPKVTKGSVIVLRIAFTLKHTYYHSFHKWFTYKIPIRVGRFIHNTSSNCIYKYKTYGNRYKFKADVYNKGLTKTWTINEYEPKKNIDYLDYKSITEPKILVKLLEVKSWNKKYNSEKKIIKKYKNEFFGISLKFKGESFQKTLKSCISNTKEPLQRAKNILKWVQDNMTSTGVEHDKFGDITKSEEASEIQIACLCNAMFIKAGLKSNVVITGGKNYYAIDTTFLIKRNYIITPVSVVTINEIKYVAYPFYRGYELGEYPLSFNNVLCMNIKEKEIQPLPAAKWGKIWIKEKIVTDLNSSPGSHILILEFRQNSASAYRDDYLGLDKSELKEEFEDWIKDYKQSNVLKSFEIKNLNNYDRPLLVLIHFNNDDTPIPFGNKKIFQLKNFFLDYFEDISTDRKEDVFIHNPATYIDEIEVLKISGKKIKLDIKSEKIKCPIFTADFSQSETDSSFIFTRILKYIPKHIKGTNCKELTQYVDQLNNIKNSSIIIE